MIMLLLLKDIEALESKHLTALYTDGGLVLPDVVPKELYTRRESTLIEKGKDTVLICGSGATLTSNSSVLKRRLNLLSWGEHTVAQRTIVR